LSGEYTYGKYETPFGFGRLVIDRGTAYGETFETANALRFEGSGVRLDAIQIRKNTGNMTGAAWVGWDGVFLQRRRLENPGRVDADCRVPRAPLSGLLHHGQRNRHL
jgi:hypothetical protein